MKKKKFLELLSKKINYVDNKDKQKILDKYDKKIKVKMKFLSEREAVSKFNVEKIVKKELCLFKIKTFFIKVFNGILSFIKLVYLKVFNCIKVFTKKKPFSNNSKKIKKEKQLYSGTENLRLKNKWCRLLMIFLYILLLVILFVLCIFFFVNVIALLDGIRIFSFISTTCLFIICIILLLFLLNSVLHNIKIDFRKVRFHFVILVMLLGCSVGYSIYEFYKLSEIDDFSDAYTMSSETDFFDLMEDDTLDIQFNSEYDTQYQIKYDNSLEGQIKIVTNYYRNYYDYVIKKNRWDIYISFHVNIRNVVSTLIDGLREDKLYNLDELKRYDITIYISEDDKDKINVY